MVMWTTSGDKFVDKNCFVSIIAKATQWEKFSACVPITCWLQCFFWCWGNTGPVPERLACQTAGPGKLAKGAPTLHFLLF